MAPRLLHLRATAEAATSSDLASATPVTWRVAFWVLITLAINSMAQPTGRLCGVSSRYRVYLSSSPILCTADALSTAIRLVVTTLYLRISPHKAGQLILLERSNASPTGPEVDTGPEPLRQTWPRWLFFLMGVLPMAIKLASFSGTPWTQAWGLMFATSFITIELITLLARVGWDEETKSVPAVLGHTLIEWQDPQRQDLRSKVARLTKISGVLDKVTFAIALLTHLGIGSWVITNLWIPAKDSVTLPENMQSLGYWTRSAIIILFVLLLISIIVLRLLIGRIPHKLLLFNILKWLIFLILLSTTLPRSQKEKDKYKDKDNKLIDIVTIWEYLYAIFWICHKGMTFIGKRWPIISRMLLIENREKDGGQSGRQVSSIVVGEEKGPIEDTAWQSFCFFSTNLVACVLWYAFKYDQIDTVNPVWTDAFG